MITLHKACFHLLALALFASTCVTASADSPRQYDVELLIFQNLVENDAGEIWPAEHSNWYDDVAEAPAAGGGIPPLYVTWLPDSSLHLKAERNALAGSRGYRPLGYLAWRQPVLARDQAQPLQIPASRSNRGSAYVDGTVKVAVERYLHLYLDLQLHLPDSVTRSGDSGAPVAESPEIRLTEQRRMRSGELHYFDNPRFGVIALITPYEPPAESGATNITEPQGSSEPAPGGTPQGAD